MSYQLRDVNVNCSYIFNTEAGEKNLQTRKIDYSVHYSPCQCRPDKVTCLLRNAFRQYNLITQVLIGNLHHGCNW